MSRKMTKAQAGSLGGRATLARHGRGHFSEIGKKGALALHKKYRLLPVGINEIALVCRDTGQPVAYLSGSSLPQR